MTLTSKVFRIDKKIIISICQSKSVPQTVREEFLVYKSYQCFAAKDVGVKAEIVDGAVKATVNEDVLLKSA